MRTILTAIAVAMAATTAHAQDVRTTVQLTTGWRFHHGDLAELPVQVASAEGWTSVSVPHSWNRIGYYLPDPQRHVNRIETINKYQGVGWYRVDFTPTTGFASKRAWLQSRHVCVCSTPRALP